MGKSTVAHDVRASRNAGVRCRRRGPPAPGARRRAGRRDRASAFRARSMAAARSRRACRVGARRSGRARRARSDRPSRRSTRRATRFIAEHPRRARRSLFDIPLLFETGGERQFDKVIVVSAPAEVQRAARAAAAGNDRRRSSTAILARQMPDAEKRAPRRFRHRHRRRPIHNRSARWRDILACLGLAPGG